MRFTKSFFNFLFTISLFFMSGIGMANEIISANETIHHIGETKTVCGFIASAKYASFSRGSPTFLNLDRAYPNHIFSAVIWGDNRSLFSPLPETLLGSNVCVTGIIKLYRGVSEMILNDPSQLQVGKQ